MSMIHSFGELQTLVNTAPDGVGTLLDYVLTEMRRPENRDLLDEYRAMTEAFERIANECIDRAAQREHRGRGRRRVFGGNPSSAC